MTTRLAALVSVLLAAWAPAVGQDESFPPDATVKALTLRPAAEPRPALKYTLMPHVLDQTEGNAATAYKALMEAWDARDDHDELDKQVAGWLDQPIDTLPLEEVRRALGAYPLEELHEAARMEACDWALPIRTQGINLMLPSVGTMRNFTRAIALQARLQVHDGDFAAAIESLQTGFAMADHTGRPPLLICRLVDVAMATTMLDVVETWIETPGSPNLYWALAALDRPLVPMEQALQWERSIIMINAPLLRQVASGEMTAEQWEAVEDESRRIVGELLGLVRDASGDAELLAPTVLAMKYYAPATAWLEGQGYSPEAVERMPVFYVTLRYLVGDFQYWSSEQQKWYHVPYWQAHRRIDAARDRYEEAMGAGEVGPLARLLIPAVGRAVSYVAVLDRRVAALQTIEALRMQAATDGGAWPGAPADIDVVPLPINPVTGEPFGFRRTDEGAVLAAGALEGMDPKWWVRYELTFEDPSD